MDFFSPEFVELHNDEEQLRRQDESSKVEMERVAKKTQIGRTKYGDWVVSLESCTCKDFQTRQLPCKHMYKLAKELKLFVNKNERSRKLIADFANGYADGWKFIVRPCNYSALDIISQSVLAEGEKRGKNSKKEPCLTQGSLYNFQRGSIFYDNLAAYTDIWGDALKKINFCVQIDAVSESFAVQTVGWADGHLVRTPEPIYGVVDFSVYSPNAERTRLEKIKSFSCRQDEFVSLLKTGEFADENGEIQNLWEINS